MLYAIQRGVHGPIKLGLAGDPPRRLRSLQTAHDEQLFLRAAWEGELRDEAKLHSRFAASRLRGEWFHPTPELQAFVDSRRKAYEQQLAELAAGQAHPRPRASRPRSRAQARWSDRGAAGSELATNERARHRAPPPEFDAKRLRTNISVPTLVGVVATVMGAPLGCREFDVLTMLSRLFVDATDSAGHGARRATLRQGRSMSDADEAAATARNAVIERGCVETTMYKLTQVIYGEVSRERYATIGRAIDRLQTVAVTVPDFDPEQASFDAQALLEVCLVAKVVVSDQQRRFELARRDCPQELARTFGRAKGRVTLKIKLGDWLRDALISRLGEDLNFDVQRALCGQAKSLWVQLEAFRFTQVEGEELESFELLMNDCTFAGLGLHCGRPSDNVTKIRARLNAILDVDPTYVSHKLVRDPADRRRSHSIIVTRATGGLRQQHLLARRDAARAGRQIAA